MRIELLYFEGCPSWQKGLDNLRAALLAEELEADIHLLRIEDEETASKERFLGSPSFRISGQDFWPEEREAYHLSCRVYSTEEGLRGFPTVAMLRDKIRKIKTGADKG